MHRQQTKQTQCSSIIHYNISQFSQISYTEYLHQPAVSDSSITMATTMYYHIMITNTCCQH